MDRDFFLELFDSVSDGLYFVDNNMTIRYWSKGAERITGYMADEILGKKCSENLLRHIDAQGNELCVVGCPLTKTLQDRKMREADVFLHHKDGHRVPVSVRIRPFHEENGVVSGAAEIFTDHSNRLDILKELEVLRKEAYIDPLTEIANRRYAESSLDSRLEERKNFRTPLGLLFLDIDKFKAFNDTHGHKTGDKVLRMVGKTLSNLMRKMDVAARWGGEEFVALLPNTDQESLAEIAERVRIHVEKNWIEVDKELLRVTVSIGGTLFKDGDDKGSFLDRADKLMYQSKIDGRNRATIAL